MTIQQHSVQSVYLELKTNGVPIGNGTGFIVQKNGKFFLVTNRHVLTGMKADNMILDKHGRLPDTVAVLHNKQDALGYWEMKEEILAGKDGKPRWYEHPVYGAKVDVVVLELCSLDGVQLYPYDLGASTDMKYGPTEMVSILGFPFGLRPGLGGTAVWTSGFVSSEPDIPYDGLPSFLIDARTRPGQSGSPVIIFRGNGQYVSSAGTMVMAGGQAWMFLGVYSGRIDEESDLGIVWKASLLHEILNSIPVTT